VDQEPSTDFLRERRLLVRRFCTFELVEQRFDSTASAFNKVIASGNVFAMKLPSLLVAPAAAMDCQCRNT
jgi:hypothetical protein